MPDGVDRTTTKLVVPELAEHCTSHISSQGCAVPAFARAPIDFADKARVEAVLKDLPMDEFLRLVENSSAEELQTLLRTVDTADSAQRFVKSRTALRKFVGAFEFLFEAAPYNRRSPFAVIGWWESRRIAYNILVGLAGLFTMVQFDVLGFASFRSLVGFAVAYGVVANFFYTSGWLAELFARLFWQEKTNHFGPILFSLGLAFSLVLTFMPGVLALVSYMTIRLLGHSVF